MPEEIIGGTPASPADGSSVATPAQAAGTDSTAQEGVVAATPQGSPAAGAGAPQAQTLAPQESGIEDSLPSVDAELEAKPGFQAVRSSYQRMRERALAAEAKLAAASPTPTTDAFVQVDAPVEDWDADAQLDRLRTEVPPYYNKMAWAVIERHLPDVLPIFLDNANKLPPDLAPLVEASATAILQAYTGMEPEHIGAAIRQYQAQMGMGGAASPGLVGSQSPAPVDVTQLGLDPTNPAHQAVARRLAQLESSVGELTQAEQTRVGQTSQERVASQVESFKTNLLSRIEVPPGYDYVKAEIVDRAERAFERDPQVIQAKADLEKFYKQGTPDLRAAAAKATQLQERYSFHFKAVAEPRLNEVKELERLKSSVSQTQAGVKNIPPGAGTGAPAGAPAKVGKPITPDTIGDLAWERVKSSKLNPNPLS